MSENRVNALLDALARAEAEIKSSSFQRDEHHEWRGLVNGMECYVEFIQRIKLYGFGRYEGTGFYSCRLSINGTNGEMKPHAYTEPASRWNYDRLAKVIIARVNKAKEIKEKQEAIRRKITYWEEIAERLSADLDQSKAQVLTDHGDGLTIRLYRLDEEKATAILTAITPILKG